MSTDLKWVKSSYSGSGGGECVEIARTATTIHIRDSKTATTPTTPKRTLQVTPTTWTAFLSALA
jgi:hypothetical protein